MPISARRAQAGDELLSRLIPTVRFQADGLAPGGPQRVRFARVPPDAEVGDAVGASGRGIRYTLDGSAPYASRPAEEDAPAGGAGKPAAGAARRGADCRTYAEPVVLAKTTTVRAAAFDAAGQPVGHAGGEVFHFEKHPAP